MTETRDKTSTTVSPASEAAPVPALRSPVPDSPAPTPRKRRWVWAASAVMVIVLGLLGYVWVGRSAPPLVPVEIATLEPATRVLAVNGRIAAARSVDVRPLVGGTLNTLTVAEGDSVSENQILAQIAADAQNAILRQAIAGLDAALVGQSASQQAFDRAQALGRNIARTELDAAGRAVEAAAQDVARTTALVDQARIALGNYTVRAPIAGTAIALNVEAGQILDPSTVLMTLADLSDLLVETDVDETYATQVAQGQSVVLQLAGESDLRDGHVSFVASRVNATTGGLAVKITFDAPVTAPVGLTVTANIMVEQRAAALTLPRSAIVTKDETSGIYVVTDGTARFQAVTVVDWPATRLIVNQGLAEGAAVIIDAATITDGQAVTAELP